MSNDDNDIFKEKADDYIKREGIRSEPVKTAAWCGYKDGYRDGQGDRVHGRRWQHFSELIIILDGEEYLVRTEGHFGRSYIFTKYSCDNGWSQSFSTDSEVLLIS